MKRVLIIGTGGIGKRHIRGFLKTGRARLSVVEPDEGRRVQVCRQYGMDAGAADICEVDLTAFDAAVICAPAHTHVALGQTCADAGLHLLVEKPLSVDMEGVATLIETVRRGGLVARVGYVRRAAEETIRLRDAVLEGRIGRVRMCYVNCSQEFARYRPDYRSTYYAKRAMGGGAILDAASHMIDLLLWIMGDVSEVAAMYDRLELENVECEDSVLISLRFTSGAMAQININQFQKPNTCTVEMVGTKGNMILDSARSQIRLAVDDSGEWQVEDIGSGLDPMEIHEARFEAQARLFLDALEGKPCQLATLEEARDNLRIALAAKESYEIKRIVQIR